MLVPMGRAAAPEALPLWAPVMVAQEVQAVSVVPEAQVEDSLSQPAA
jgi:hypothetical protein